MINDDRFIMGSLDHWEFGEDNTGDLMNRANLEQQVAAAGQLGGAGEVSTALHAVLQPSQH